MKLSCSKRGLAALALFVVSAALFYVSPVRQLADSRFCFMVSEQILTKGRITLTEYFRPPLDPAHYEWCLRAKDGYPYHIDIVGDRLYYWYPPGSSILSLPFVAALNAAGLSTISERGDWDRIGEYRMQQIVAALLSAFLLVLVFWTALEFLDPGRSFLLAAITGFATPVWSTTSRVVWSDTWAILLLMLLLLHLARGMARGTRLRPMLIATLLSWLYIVKPTYSTTVLLVGLYAAWHMRRSIADVAWLVGVGVGWIGLFVGYSMMNFGTLLPDYYIGNSLQFDTFWTSFSGLMASPSRGLLTTMPASIVLLFLTVRHRDVLTRHGGLGWLCAASIVVGILLLSFWRIWWAGHCFGARYMVNAVPWMALLGAIVWKAALERPAAGGGAVLRGGAALLIGLSVVINASGALNRATNHWNSFPANVDTHNERLWDWTDPQALAGLLPQRAP